MADRRWTVTWGLAALIVVGAMATWEGAWRMCGFEPSVSEDVGLWSLERERAVAGGNDAVAIIGSSRVRIGISPQALAEATGWRRPVQLAIDFSSPPQILENLAADPRFRGLVIVDVAPVILFNDRWPKNDPMSARYLSRHASERWSEGLETRLTVFLESTFAFRLPQLSGKHILDAVRSGEWPDEQRFLVERHRETHLRDEWSGADAPVTVLKDPGVVPISSEALDALIARLNRAIAQIRSRGGRVVFVQMPTSGAMGELEQRLFPREKYWDVLAAKVNGVAINSGDYPELAGFLLPDGSHLRASDAVAFSRALGSILVKELAGGDESASAG